MKFFIGMLIGIFICYAYKKIKCVLTAAPKRKSKRMKEYMWLAIQLIAWLTVLLLIIYIPENLVIIFIGLIVFHVGKKLWHVPIGTIKRKRK